MFTQANAYERFMGRWSRVLARRFVEFVDFSQARHVLDIGCGTGALTQAILEAAPQAQVVGVDPSPAFVEAARSRAQPRARFEVADAERLPFEDGTFDVACACLVLNFIPDQRAALAEMRRVVRSEGKVAAVIWNHTAGVDMLKTFWDVADALDPGKRAAHEPALLDHDGLLRLWQQADLHEIVIAPLTFMMNFSSFADYWEPFGLGQGPAGAYLANVAPATRKAIEQELRRRLIHDGLDAPFGLTARAWAIRGNVPKAQRPCKTDCR